MAIDYRSLFNLGSSPTANQSASLSPVKTNSVQGASTYKPPTPVKVPTGIGPGPSGTSYNVPSNTVSSQQPSYDALNAQKDTINQQIEADYGNAMSQLSSSESGLRGQADIANQTIDQQSGAAQNEITNAQTLGQQGVQSTLDTAQTSANQAQAQARDMFSQQQQSNNAQLSALGLSSSSVTEALAERLGVETARRIAGVNDNLSTIRTNAAKELGRINTYYQGKIADVQNQVTIEKSKIQQSLIQGLQQIANAKYQAASDKAAARSNLLGQVTSAISSLTQQQQQFQESLQSWAAQKQAALQPIASDPNYFATQQQKLGQINTNFAPTGFSYAPKLDANGTVTGYVLQKKNDPNDPKKNTDPTDPNADFASPSWL